jgi:hypothetical protein
MEIDRRTDGRTDMRKLTDRFVQRLVANAPKVKCLFGHACTFVVVSFFFTRDAFEFRRSECTQICAVSAHISCIICYKCAYCYGVKVVRFFYQFVLLDITLVL